MSQTISKKQIAEVAGIDLTDEALRSFDAMYKVARADPTVFAVSAWTDNGFAGAPRASATLLCFRVVVRVS